MKVAIFDFDLTLTNDFVSALLNVELEKKKIIKKGYIKFYDGLITDFVSGKCGYNDASNQEFIKRAEYMDGVSVLEFQRFVTEEFNLDQYINPWVNELFSHLREKGYLIVVISGALEQFLEVAQEKLDFDTFFGSKITVKDGKFVNSPDLFMNDEKKATIVKQIVKDSDYSLGFGDSAGDIEMLRLLDKSFLYQPKEEAEKIASQINNISIVNGKNILETVLPLL